MNSTTEKEKPFMERFRDALGKPVTLVIAGLVFMFTALGEYVISRVMDAIWEVEPPEEVVKLNSELHSASGELKSTSKDLERLLSRINTAKIEDPQLREQLGQLDTKLASLNELVIKTSQQTDKVATISEALQEDWKRVKEKTGGDVDGVPDVILGQGEGVQLCSGLASLGLVNIQKTIAWIVVGSQQTSVKTGGRVKLDDASYVDFIGTRNKKALFKVYCDNS